jgi:putative restriction endonuclease
MNDEQQRFRQRLFQLLNQRLERGDPALTYKELAAFDVDGQPTRLIANSKGIWNPRWLDETLAIRSSLNSPYQDQELEPGIWRYDYQALSDQGDNRKLRLAFERRTAIIWIREIAKGAFIPHFPVYVIEDNQTQKYFKIAVEEVQLLAGSNDVDSRRYVERMVKQRVHQPEFRGKVLIAYRNRCTVCQLNHPELLDAAHILPDSHELGRPVVTNGLSMCKIHHSAYDNNFLGISPDYTIHINKDLLEERDGPMLKHGLQEMHGQVIQTPKSVQARPKQDFLGIRFEEFQGTK